MDGLEDGVGAGHGTDAVAGMVNFITRKDLFRDGAFGLNVAFDPMVPASNPGNPYGGAVTFGGRVPCAPINDPIPSYTTTDLYYTYTVPKPNLTTRPGVQNLFDRLPPLQGRSAVLSVVRRRL